jgi:hypothetical protein
MKEKRVKQGCLEKMSTRQDEENVGFRRGRRMERGDDNSFDQNKDLCNVLTAGKRQRYVCAYHKSVS